MEAPSSADPQTDTIAVRLLPCGDTALTVEFGDRVDRRVSALVLALAERLRAAAIAGVIETVPTFRSLTIHYDPLALSQAGLKARLAPLLPGLRAAEGRGRRWRIPVCYHHSVAPDLAEVAERTKSSVAQVIAAHSGVTYHVYMMGFLPGHPYMGDLPSVLELPRRENPRTAVPAGSVSIATTLTAIYPLESPGGWHLIGRTPAPVWDKRLDRPAILAAGDEVRFEPISLADLATLTARAALGEWHMEPESGPREGARAELGGGAASQPVAPPRARGSCP
jgi:KipI family sensor histidine kinase inhibitor